MSSVADSGPPIHLHEVRRLDLLAVVAPLIIPTPVRAELLRKGVWSALRRRSRIELRVQRVSASAIQKERRRWTTEDFADADLSVLVLARRSPRDLVLTDDLRLRRCAEQIRRRVVGTVGILVRAYRLKRINLFQLRRAIDELFDDSSLYLSAAFRRTILELLRQLEGK